MPKLHKAQGNNGSQRKLQWQANVRVENVNTFLGYFATKEEAQEAEDKFRAERDDPNTYMTQCYCETTWVWIPRSWINKFTKSCGRTGCVHPLMNRVGNGNNRPKSVSKVSPIRPKQIG